MGINVELIAISSQLRELVLHHLHTFMESRRLVLQDRPAPKQPGAPGPFLSRPRRLLFLVENGGWCFLCERGEMAEPALAQYLSRGLSCEVQWVSLHEVSNAWGARVFRSGRTVEEILRPSHLFRDGPEEEFEGDATEEAFDYCEAQGMPDLFPSYSELIEPSESRPPEEVASHLYFARRES